MAMTAQSLKNRWKAILSSEFEGEINEELMRRMAQCIIDEIQQNAVVYTNVTGTAGSFPVVGTGIGAIDRTP